MTVKGKSLTNTQMPHQSEAATIHQAKLPLTMGKQNIHRQIMQSNIYPLYME